MLEISRAEVTSNIELRANKFHYFVSGIIKSDISVDGKFPLWGNFGDGLKEGIVGIQAVVQIGRSEVTKTWRQVPKRSRDLHFCIPFHNHEAEVLEGGEYKKFPYLIYLFWGCWTQTFLLEVLTSKSCFSWFTFP
jgi:hypothetical protein